MFSCELRVSVSFLKMSSCLWRKFFCLIITYPPLDTLEIFLPILYTTWDNHSICWSHGTSPRTLGIIQYYVGQILNKNQNIYLVSNNLSLSQKKESHPYWIQVNGEWKFCWVGLTRIPTIVCFLMCRNNGYVLTLFQCINLPTKVWNFKK